MMNGVENDMESASKSLELTPQIIYLQLMVACAP